MTLYTIVDESYDVKIFNKKQLLEYLNSILIELNQYGCIKLFIRDSMDWKYKIQKH